MKKNILLLSLIAFNLCATENAGQATTKEFCKDQASCEDVNNACQCYCEVGQNPRDKVPGQDHPIFYTPEQDPYGKSCYCGPRDLKVLEAQASGISHDDAVAKFKEFFPTEEESKQIKEQFAKK